MCKRQECCFMPGLLTPTSCRTTCSNGYYKKKTNLYSPDQLQFSFARIKKKIKNKKPVTLKIPAKIHSFAIPSCIQLKYLEY